MAVLIPTADEIRAIVREELRAALREGPASGVLSTTQAAEVAGVARKTVNEWISSGALPAGRRGRVRTIRREDLDHYLAGDRAGGPVPVADLRDSLRRRSA